MIDRQGIFLSDFALLFPMEITREIARKAGLDGVEIVLTRSTRKHLDKILSLLQDYGLQWRFHLPFANAWFPNVSPFDFLIWLTTREIPLRVTAKEIQELIEISRHYQTPCVIHSRFMETVREICRGNPVVERLVMLHTKPEPGGPIWPAIRRYLQASDIGFALDTGYGMAMMGHNSLLEAASILAKRKGSELHYYDAIVTEETDGTGWFHMTNKNLIPGHGNLPLKEIRETIRIQGGNPAIVLETFPTVAWAAFVYGGLDMVAELILGLINNWVFGKALNYSFPPLGQGLTREVFQRFLVQGEEGVIRRLELAALKRDWST